MSLRRLFIKSFNLKSKNIITSLLLILLVIFLIANHYTLYTDEELSSKMDSKWISSSNKLILKCSEYKRNIKVKNRIYNLVYDRLEALCDKEVFHFFTTAQIQLSQQFLINKPNYCGSDSGISLKLVVIVISNIINSDQRSLIRDKWGKSIREKGFQLLFLVAKNSDDSVQKKLLIEDIEKKDIIQAAFDEDYYNATLKTFSVFHWIKMHCENVKFVLKSDEDMVVDVDELLNVLDNYKNDKKIMLGPYIEASPERDVNSKFFVPEFIYKDDKYPLYVSGGFMVFSGDCISPILQQAQQLTPLYMEDVYFAGIAAEKVGVKRVHIRWNGVFGKSVAYHGFRGRLFKIMSGIISNKLIPG